MSTVADSGYRQDVQGLRALAVVAVILYHASGMLPGGFLGVDVFFVISGFVITRSLVREHDRDGRISLLGFYRRRIHRLTPALAVLLLFVLPISVLFAPMAAVRTTTITGIAAALFSANLTLAAGPGYFDLGAESNPLAHTWSLSLEEQFYLVFPALFMVLAAVGARRSTSRRALTVGLAVVGVLSLGGCLAAAAQPGAFAGTAWSRIAFFAMPLRAWQFVGGALIALIGVRRITSVWHTAASVAGALLVVGSFAFIDDVLYPNIWATVPTIGTMMLIATPSSAIARALSWRPIVRAGDLSYSWYLWHWPAMVFFRVNGVESNLALAAVGLATYPVAVISYRFVEERYRSTKQAAPRRWVKIASVSIASTIVVGAASLVTLELAQRSAPVEAAFIASTGASTLACDDVQLTPDLHGCKAATGTRRIAVFGDSNAEQFASTVVLAARPLDASVTMVIEQGCPLVDVVVVKYGDIDPVCRARAEAALPWLVEEGFDVVVLANAFDAYLQTPNERVAAVDATDIGGAQAYTMALSRLVRDLEANGTTVIVIHPIPKPEPTLRHRENFRTTSGCPLIGIAVTPDTNPLACRDSFSREVARANQRIAVDAELAATEGTAAVLIDPFDLVCRTQCLAHDDEQWIYQDYGHLTREFAEARFLPVIEEALRNAFASVDG